MEEKQSGNDVSSGLRVLDVLMGLSALILPKFMYNNEYNLEMI
jgi:hypothetical protein